MALTQLLPLKAFEKTHDTRHTVFGRNGDEHMHVIGHQIPLLDHPLLLLRQPVKDVLQVPPEPPIADFLAVLGCENHVGLAFPCAIVQVIGNSRHGRSPWSIVSIRDWGKTPA